LALPIPHPVDDQHGDDDSGQDVGSLYEGEPRGRPSIVGMVGAVVAGLLLPGFWPINGVVGAIVHSAIGAIIVLLVISLVKRAWGRSRPHHPCGLHDAALNGPRFAMLIYLACWLSALGSSLQGPHDRRMADMVVVGYRPQALTLPHHADGLALLVRC
jgi:hypothetical protein